MVMEFKVDQGKKLQNAFTEAAKSVEDFTIPFTLITQSWYKSNRAIFALKGPGKYADLSAAYKPQKNKAVGFIYPILQRTGALARSITQPGASFTIARIVNKQSLFLGSNIPYGPYHQFGTSKMPKRPWVLLGPEQVSPPEVNRRVDAWISLINNFVMQTTASKVGVLK